MSEFLRVAEIVLRQRAEPLSAKDIWAIGKRDGLFSDKITGKTPWQTLKSKLSVHIRKYGPQSKFVRTAPGRFYLRDLVGNGTYVYSAPPQRPPSKEYVVSFPSSRLDDVGRFQGIIDQKSEVLDHVLSSDHLKVMQRTDAEQNDAHKQLLVYVLVRRPGYILAYTRGTYSLTDKMLHGSRCVGFGGHVTRDDLDLLYPAGLENAVARELREELDLPHADNDRLKSGKGLICVGLLNDDSSPVGRRHFAVVYEYWVQDSDEWASPARGEKSITQLEWIRDDGHGVRLEEYEYWSQLALRRALVSDVGQEPSYRLRNRRNLRTSHSLVITGQIGSGKTELSRFLEANYGYAVISSGRLMAQLLNLPSVPSTPRDIFQAQAAELISRPKGPARLAGLISEEVARHRSERVIIDGIRHRRTFEAVLEAIDRPIGLIYVETTPDVAFHFYRQRETPVATMSEFLNVRDGPGEEGVRDLRDRADIIIYNWHGLENYWASLEKLMRDLAIGK
jgi:predicted NUDIX family phosphoesterase